MTTIVIVHDTVDSFGFVLLADSLATLLGVLIQLYELYDFWDLKEHPLEALDIARVGSQLIWIFLQLCKLWMLLYPQSAVKYESWHCHQEIKPRRFPEAILDKDGQIRPLETDKLFHRRNRPCVNL
ncbi:hypothetical protein quinque_004683 [Culex quinquefasciatus]